LEREDLAVPIGQAADAAVVEERLVDGGERGLLARGLEPDLLTHLPSVEAERESGSAYVREGSGAGGASAADGAARPRAPEDEALGVQVEAHGAGTGAGGDEQPPRRGAAAAQQVGRHGFLECGDGEAELAKLPFGTVE